MTTHTPEHESPMRPGPVARDIVLRRDGRSVTMAQVPGLPQLVCRTFAEASRVAGAFAAVHGVDVWYAVGRQWKTVAAHRRPIPGAAATVPLGAPLAPAPTGGSPPGLQLRVEP